MVLPITLAFVPLAAVVGLLLWPGTSDDEQSNSGRVAASAEPMALRRLNEQEAADLEHGDGPALPPAVPNATDSSMIPAARERSV